MFITKNAVTKGIEEFTHYLLSDDGKSVKYLVDGHYQSVKMNKDAFYHLDEAKCAARARVLKEIYKVESKLSDLQEKLEAI